MNKSLKQTALLYTVLFWCGYASYIALEVTVRGRSHWSMGIAAGLALIVIDDLNDTKSKTMDLLLQGVLGSLFITAVELFIGYTVISGGHERIWDYRNLPFSDPQGTVNLFFSLLWILLSIACVFIGDSIRYYIFHGHRPTYSLFGHKFKLPERVCK